MINTTDTPAESRGRDARLAVYEAHKATITAADVLIASNSAMK